MSRDLWIGLRALLRRPALLLLTVVTLGLGLGVNTAVFSLIEGVLIRPLPYGDPDQLVWVYGRNTERDNLPLSPPDFLDYRSANQCFSGQAALQDEELNLTGGDTPEHVRGAAVSARFFQTLRVPQEAGRLFTDEEEKGNGGQVVILGDDLWRRRFGASPDVVGKTVRLDGKEVSVVGIMPAGFRLPEGAELWVPMSFAGKEMAVRRFHFLSVVGRLKPGTTLKAAQQNLDVVANQLSRANPDDKGWGVRLVPLKDHVVGDVRVALLVLFGAVAIVLLIACANVASLLLVRGVAREREIAIRTALGAPRSRIVGQLLGESLLLAVFGGALGLGLAGLSLRLLVSLNPGNIPRLGEVRIDAVALGFALLAAVVATLLAGLAPALFTSRPNLQASLKESGRSSTTTVSGRGLSKVMVVAEVALATALLIGTGLLTRSFQALMSVDPGFRSDHVLTTGIVLTSPRYTSPNLPAPFFQALLQRVSALPGVAAAGVVNHVPLSGEGGDVPFTVEGRVPEGPNEQLFAFYRVASSDYFRAMSIPLLRGRSFTEHDSKDAPKVVIVDQALAQGLWPNASPLGQRLHIDLGEPYVAEVIGVVGSIRHSGLSKQPFQTLYLSYLQDQWPNLNLVTRTTPDPSLLSGHIRREVAQLDPAQPVAIRTLSAIVAKSVARPRFNMLLLSVFAGLALLLAIVGIYGVISYSVSQRRREIGIRVALGAGPRATLGLVLREGMVLAAIGLGMGLAFAAAATRALSSLLYEVSSTDPLVYLAAAATLAGIALLACLVPARRAVKIDPLTAIQEER